MERFQGQCSCLLIHGIYLIIDTLCHDFTGAAPRGWVEDDVAFDRADDCGSLSHFISDLPIMFSVAVML